MSRVVGIPIKEIRIQYTKAKRFFEGRKERKVNSLLNYYSLKLKLQNDVRMKAIEISRDEEEFDWLSFRTSQEKACVALLIAAKKLRVKITREQICRAANISSSRIDRCYRVMERNMKKQQDLSTTGSES